MAHHSVIDPPLARLQLRKLLTLASHVTPETAFQPTALHARNHDNATPRPAPPAVARAARTIYPGNDCAPGADAPPAIGAGFAHGRLAHERPGELRRAQPC